MEKEKWLQSIGFYLLDMDGTLYLGDQLYPFTKELLKTFRETGRKYLFLTNNSSKSTEDYVKKLGKLGIEATAEDFQTSAQATAFYLKKYHPGKRLYVCGTASFQKELESQGFEITQDLEKTQCLVMGYDTELTYQKLIDVSKLLLGKPDLPYIATNPDLVCPTEFGSVPDCGSICQMLYNVSGRKPEVIGKPGPLMAQLAMEKWGYTKEQTAMVGDRIYTDVKSGLNAGITGILVMSGETTPEILEKSPDKPHLVLQDASEILDAIRGNQFHK